MTIPKKLFVALDLPVLSELLRDADIKVVDVGGRGSALYPLLTLAPFTHYFVSEPDASEAERLKQQLPRDAPWRGVTVIAEALASADGVAALHVTAEPGMSSLLEPDLRVTERYCLASKFRVMSAVTVATMRLDAAAARYGFADAAFLKLDTQGTELDILRSGGQLVAGSLAGVHTEASFHPFYKGQALFADVDAHLRRHGFHLFALTRTLLRRSGYREALYSRRTPVWAHCLYLRSSEAFVAGADASRRFARLLAMAIAFQHFDLAFEIAGLGRDLQVLPEGDLTRLDAELERCAELSTRHLLHKVADDAAADSVLARSFRDRSQFE